MLRSYTEQDTEDYYDNQDSIYSSFWDPDGSVHWGYLDESTGNDFIKARANLNKTRRGGHIIFTLRPDLFEEGGFKAKHAQLEAARKWRLAEVAEPTQILPKGEPDVFHQVWVFEITS